MSAAPSAAMAELAISKEPGTQQTRSTIFCAHDADITFRSQDNVLLRVHRKNLETSSGGFPPAELVAQDDEAVSLSEDAETLELLFQFVYPRHHPTLRESETPFALLARLAEAAEKYQVFAAINMCIMRMEQALPLHPVQVLNYAVKHGYTDVVEAALPRLLDMPMECVVQALAENLVVPWVVFRERWSNAVLRVVWTPIEGTNFVTADKKKACRFGCVHGGGLVGDIWQGLGEKRSRDAVMSAYAGLKAPCAHVTIDLAAIRARLEDELGAVPAFGK